MKDLTLVVMAAGMGSRFGGLKQVEPVGLNGEFILDFSAYDALRAGFKKVVFVIKEEHLEIFKKTVGERIADKMEVDYAFQRLEDIPQGYSVPEERVKPWGTVQAILCAKDHVDGDFVVINADDFYGASSYEKAYNFLVNSNDDFEYACITYPYEATSSKHGSVKRAVCYMEDEYIVKMVESSISTVDKKAYCEPLDESQPFYIELNHPVSMNMYCFKRNFFEFLQDYFNEFFRESKDLVKDEALLTNCVFKNINLGKIKLKNVITDANWLGVTYKDDLPLVKESIQKLIDENVYNENLWK